MELINEVYDSVNHYFSILKKTGYKPYNEVYKLLVFTFIQDMLDGPMAYYITEEDYKTISDALYCLYGTCMIPYPAYKQGVSSIVNKLPDEYRVTEDKILRSTELLNLRTMS